MKAAVIFARAEEYILFLFSVSSAFCLFSVWSLSVSCFQFSVCCSLSINRSQLSSTPANCIPRVRVGLCSPEASMLAKVTAYEAWCRENMFMYLMCENSSLLFTTICSVLDMKSHLSYQHTLSQLETALLDSSHSKKCQSQEKGIYGCVRSASTRSSRYRCHQQFWSRSFPWALYPQ